MDREKELQRLSEADRHIADAKRPVARQTVALETLRRDGHNTTVAELTLKNFRDTLQTLRANRAQVIKQIDKIDRGLL
jgi:hypothetical protein